MKDAVQSTVQSQNITSAVQSIGGKVTHNTTSSDKIITEALIRKFAHFAEFFVLGFLTYMTFYFFRISRVPVMLTIPSLMFLFVAITDECLQLFSNGRAPRITDVIIDLAGAIVAFLICMSVSCVLKRVKQKDENKKSRQ